ncbi:helix-turn-helix transcriptional regulator [Mucilaginibacter sp. 10I4]|nr:helix-turn-helix transcriptional regulator [Mucilaginibacter sp. 10I4]
MIDDRDPGITIERLYMKDLLLLIAETLEVDKAVHRHDGHSFFLLETGQVKLEIDFEHHIINSPSIIYVNPDQVHSTAASDDVIIVSWALSNDNINPEYLKLLADITPAIPLTLDDDTFAIFSDAVNFCLNLYECKGNKLYHSLLKNSCNALVALVISQYLELAKPADKLSRFDNVTKAFKDLLEQNYTTIKRPADYAEKLNISTPYLNECVKNTTGHSVSHQIQQRVILEAKRLLYHSDKTVKEIAGALGYDDYPYFSRLFTKITGMSALTFRNKNND